MARTFMTLLWINRCYQSCGGCIHVRWCHFSLFSIFKCIHHGRYGRERQKTRMSSNASLCASWTPCMALSPHRPDTSSSQPEHSYMQPQVFLPIFWFPCFLMTRTPAPNAWSRGKFWSPHQSQEHGTDEGVLRSESVTGDTLYRLILCSCFSFCCDFRCSSAYYNAVGNAHNVSGAVAFSRK